MSGSVAVLVRGKVVGTGLATKAVLACLATYADDNGAKVFPSKVRIAREIQCSREQVQRSIRELVKTGVLVEVGKRGSQKTVWEYQLDIEQIKKLPDCHETDLSKCDVRSQSSVISDHISCDVRSHRLINDSSDEKNPLPPKGGSGLFADSDLPSDPGKKAKHPDSIDAGFEEFWTQWPTHKNRKAGKETAREVYRRACEGKHGKAEKIEPAVLNACAVEYVAHLKREGSFDYIKGVVPWLRQPGWEPYLDRLSRQSHWLDPLFHDCPEVSLLNDWKGLADRFAERNDTQNARGMREKINNLLLELMQRKVSAQTDKTGFLKRIAADETRAARPLARMLLIRMGEAA